MRRRPQQLKGNARRQAASRQDRVKKQTARGSFGMGPKSYFESQLDARFYPASPSMRACLLKAVGCGGRSADARQRGSQRIVERLFRAKSATDRDIEGAASPDFGNLRSLLPAGC